MSSDAIMWRGERRTGFVPKKGQPLNRAMSAPFSMKLPVDRREGWEVGRRSLAEFLAGVGVDGGTWTEAVYLHPVMGASERQLVETLSAAIGKETWQLLAGPPRAGRPAHMLALPVAHDRTKAILFPFVEIHARLVAWWLSAAWRSRQLADATWTHADEDELIPAAACARALIETAAAFWTDSRRLRDAWDEAKHVTLRPSEIADAWQSLARLLYEIQYGAKFDVDRVPDLADTYNRLKRTNVLGQIDRLAKATTAPVLEPYQWLCNTVHPSVGGTLAFSSPLLRHESKTHAVVTFAPFSTEIVGDVDGPAAERTVHEAIAIAALVAVNVMVATLDAALRVIDDICLTADVAEISQFETWRLLRRPARNERCPCRSGRKAKQCAHVWGQPAPLMPDTFAD